MADRPEKPPYWNVPEGYELVAAEEGPDWRVAEGKNCRYRPAGHRRACWQRSAAEFLRGTVRKTWWAYCPEHMYGRWIEDGRVMWWKLVPKDG